MQAHRPARLAGLNKAACLLNNLPYDLQDTSHGVRQMKPRFQKRAKPTNFSCAPSLPSVHIGTSCQDLQVS